MSVDIAVIDYGMGNLRSVVKAIEHVAPALSVVVTSDPVVIAEVNRQAAMIGYLNAFVMYTAVSFIAIPLVLLLGGRKQDPA